MAGSQPSIEIPLPEGWNKPDFDTPGPVPPGIQKTAIQIPESINRKNLEKMIDILKEAESKIKAEFPCVGFMAVGLLNLDGIAAYVHHVSGSAPEVAIAERFMSKVVDRHISKFSLEG